MPKRKSADKFHVGQTVALVLDKETGHQRDNGMLAVVTRSRIYGEWECSDPESSRAPIICKDWRYRIRRCDGHMWEVQEGMLRPIYDGEQLSTWEKFAKATGINVKVPTRAHKPKSVA